MSYRILYFLAIMSSAPSAVAEQQLASIGDLTLVSGQILEDCQVGYRTFGEMSEDKSNILVIPTWFTGKTAGLEGADWIGSGLLADTDKYFVVAIDALGNGVSSSPSNVSSGSSKDFPAISIADMVNSQYVLLTEHLGINHVRAIMGSSMGGMQTFNWIVQYPDFMDKAIPMDGSPKMTSYDLIQWQTHKDIVRALQHGGHSNTDIGVMLSRLGLLTLFTPDYFLEHVPVEELPAYLAQSDQSYSSLDVDDYVAQLEAMIDQNVFASDDEDMRGVAGRVKASVLVIGVPSDHMVNPAPAKEFGVAMDAEYFEVVSNCGHIGSSCEAAKVTERVAQFLID